MPQVGDRVEIASQKGSARTGVVTATTGEMVSVRWDTGGETTMVPGPGSVTVLGRRRAAPAK
jgi:hypothetical protein